VSTGASTSLDASGSPAAGGSGGPSAGPGTGGSSAPAAPPTTILRSGTASLVALAGQPADAYDFDSGAKQPAGADATAGVIGLVAANGARFAVLVTAATPSLAVCSTVPDSQWTGQVMVASLVPGSKVCVHTSERRFAWFMTRAGDAAAGGALFTSNLDFVVYKKAGD
jgi:hypothetical protein